jgi:hypothetical protein
MLNGALPKPDGMQAVAFVPEMSHFHAQMGRIFVDQLGLLCDTSGHSPPKAVQRVLLCLFASHFLHSNQ